MFKDKNILFLIKKKKSSYYEMLIAAIIEFGSLKNVFYVKYDSESNCNKINQEIKQCIYQNNINTFVALSYYFIDPNLLFEIQKKVYRIRIDGDDTLIFDYYSRWYAQLFDLNITSSFVNKIRFNELSYNSLIYVGNISNKNISGKSNQVKEFKCDVSFIGYMPPKSMRKVYINYLKKNNINVVVYGDNLDTIELSTENKYKTYSSSKINLNFANLKLDYNKFDDIELLRDEPDLENKLNMQGRIFEVLSAGGFMLTEYNPSLEYFFDIGEDLEVFYNESDLLEKINYYLNNEEKRILIANNGYKKFNKKYEYSIWSPGFVKEIETNILNKNIIKSFYWPKKLKKFNSRFLNKKYLLNINYIIMIFKYFDVLHLVNIVIKKIFFKIKL